MQAAVYANAHMCAISAPRWYNTETSGRPTCPVALDAAPVSVTEHARAPRSGSPARATRPSALYNPLVVLVDSSVSVVQYCLSLTQRSYLRSAQRSRVLIVYCTVYVYCVPLTPFRFGAFAVRPTFAHDVTFLRQFARRRISHLKLLNRTGLPRIVEAVVVLPEPG